MASKHNKKRTKQNALETETERASFVLTVEVSITDFKNALDLKRGRSCHDCEL